ncbi:HAD family hydrolase [Sphaerisporangium corydalis]|uniref:HAD family hydrolase n=1 Tax=Sphaerisporangium corydalis TaxID=1441875 RepID=A0ABV9ED78_9ACTN|nr:HAD family hydrolase [Sphaerisporangium corydalis]
MTHVAAFDLDGTLVDTPSAIVETFTAAFASMGAEPPDAPAIRATIGLPLEKAFSGLLGVPLDDDAVTLGVRRYQALFKELILPRAERLLFPGVVDGLTELRAQGYTLAVATSKFYASADALLTAAGLRGHFTMVVGADQVARPKPDPEMGLLIMRTLGVAPGRMVMVGDTTHDLLMARGAGIRSVAVTYGIHGLAELRTAGPTWVADTFGDVVRFIREGFSSAVSVGDVSFGDASAGDVSVGELSVSELSVSELSVSELSVSEFSIAEVSEAPSAPGLPKTLV